jgi:uncharacterized protein YndB with AHSA1/START domain
MREKDALDAHLVSAERVIAAPPEAIFDLLADPSRHPDLDGSGQLRGVRSGTPERLSLEATFGMSMHLGVGYSMVNTVIEFEENRRIAWQSRLAGRWGHVLGGRIWRYELEPTDGGTRVRESWDISQEKVKAIVRPARKRTRQAMLDTLERIEALVTATS